MSDTFKCAMCKQVFSYLPDDIWNDEEAKKEFKQLFPNSDWEKRDIVCDDCWAKVKPNEPQRIH